MKKGNEDYDSTSVTHMCNLNTREAEAEGSGVQGQSGNKGHLFASCIVRC